MKILIACESSGVIREAFRRRGHFAMSCDLLETEQPGPHYCGDVRDVLCGKWDMLIAHPTCTYLTNSGVRWLHTEPGRWDKMREGVEFFRMFDQCEHIPLRAVENPIPHGHARALMGRKYDQIIQPWMFGHGETKATCLWLTGLPKLLATNVVDGREARVHRMPPGPNRWRERSRTPFGYGEAMADQWGNIDAHRNTPYIPQT